MKAGHWSMLGVYMGSQKSLQELLVMNRSYSLQALGRVEVWFGG